MPNRLVHENSLYLLQHKDNPVDWYPWGEEALARARNENKPIFLSIGYAACHWCHVMERESFEDENIAAMMNAHFINIKVDREERPDLDRIYMDAVVAITGQGGWPMSVFLTPDGKPFYGGTYFPPTRRYGMPSFRDVLEKVSSLWHEQQSELEESSEKLTAHIQARSGIPGPDADGELTPETLEHAALKLAQGYDWRNGGWGQAPKFPQAMALRFLLRRASRGDKMALEISEHALKAMAKGGMYDLIGGGFARYSVDNDWLIPHFEKMLYDNAQLAQVYLHAYLVTGNAYYRQICEETLDFVLAEMTHEQGGFFSSIDADSQGEEGLFYTWTFAEVKEILTPEELTAFEKAYTLTEGGNFEGRNTFQRKVELEELAQLEPVLAPARRKLKTVRDGRIRPATDDKVLTAWNAWMAIPFAEAARYLGRPDYLQAVQRNLAFIQQELYAEGKLLRSWRSGHAQHNAYLEDYASLILALLALYQSDHQARWYAWAAGLTEEMIANFYDEENGFYDTRHDHPDLILRPQESQDNATPSGASLAVQALLQMAAYTGEDRTYRLAIGTLAPMQGVLAAYPTAFGSWLSALDFALASIREVALLGDLESDEANSLLAALWKDYRPDLLLAAAPYPPDTDAPPLLAERPLPDGQPTVYVCRNFTCQQPTTDPAVLREQLG